MNDDDVRRSEHGPRWLRWLTRVSLAIGIAALIATVWFVGVDTILGYLSAIGWFFVVLVAIEMMASVLDGTAIYFMAHGKGRPSWRESVVAQIVGRGVNSVTPGGNLGEALKIGLLSKRCPARRIVAAVMYVLLVGVTLSFAVIAIGAAVTAFWFDVQPVMIAVLLAGAVVAAGIAIAIVVLLRRGMLSTLTGVLARLHLISQGRRERWNETLHEVDARLRGADDGDFRRRAIACIAISQLLQKGLSYFTILAAGYALSPGQFLALLSAGVLLQWASTIVPLGLGLAEGGNAALFLLIGAPAGLGLTLALARRVNQIVFATIGFVVLAADRVGLRMRGHLSGRFLRSRRSTSACAQHM